MYLYRTEPSEEGLNPTLPNTKTLQKTRFLALLPAILSCFGPLAAQKAITLEDIWLKGTFSAKGVPGFNFQNDGAHYTRLEGGRIAQYDLRDGQRSGVIFDPASVEAGAPGWDGSFDSYAFSPDESKILLAAQTSPIYRWSREAQHFVFDARTKQMTKLYEGAKQSHATFSPDGAKVAFVADNDLYYRDLQTGALVRVTRDGKKNAIINGASDWVYEEEFELVRAFQWSPDGSKLAFLRFDEREVPEMTMEMYRGGPYPELVTFKYPKVGEKNATVTAHVYHLASQKTVGVQIPMREQREGRLDDYLPRIAWAPQGLLCLTWMNRHQSTQRLFLADPGTGTCALLHEEKNERYIDLHDVVFLSDGSGFVAQSEKSGFNHLYLYPFPPSVRQGLLPEKPLAPSDAVALSKGDWDVTDFYGIDEKKGKAYFQAASPAPMFRELFEADLKGGKKPKKIKKPRGGNGAQWSSTFDYFVHQFSTLNTPPQYTVCNRKGKTIRPLEQNGELRQKQAEHGTAPLEFVTVPLADGSKGNGWLLKPATPEFQGQKLPLLLFVYGGPGSQQVTDAWKHGNYWWFQMLAQQGYVVACVDNRGTGGRGEAFKKVTYKQLGRYETEDQIAAARHLGALPFVDPQRVGIFGWSYGGYMSTNCILKGADVFRAAIAVAPVTNWKWYDSVYTERYMQTHEENELGYEQNAPTNFADQLKGKYLLVHGIADDNVHFQHAVEMANELISKNKQFDTMAYPNRNHGIAGGNTRLHLYTMMTQFLDKNLKGKPKASAP